MPKKKRQRSNGEWRPKETTLQTRASEHISESFKIHQKDNRARMTWWMTSGEILNTGEGWQGKEQLQNILEG